MLTTEENPRELGRRAVQNTVDEATWKKNRKFCEYLKAQIAKHPMANHPIIEFFDNEIIPEGNSKNLHLEFGRAFAQVFTDGVINAMALSTQLESRLGPQGKITARFLWAINLMDELGYAPSSDGENYKGNPNNAHYSLYMKTLMDLGSSESEFNTHQLSEEAKKARATYEDQYDNYVNLAVVLAMSEEIFDDFASSWAKNTARSSKVDTSQGYHTIHVEDEEGSSIEDDHSEDGWYLVAQAITPDDYETIESNVNNWLDVWYKYADKMLEIAIQ